MGTTTSTMTWHDVTLYRKKLVEVDDLRLRNPYICGFDDKEVQSDLLDFDGTAVRECVGRIMSYDRHVRTCFRVSPRCFMTSLGSYTNFVTEFLVDGKWQAVTIVKTYPVPAYGLMLCTFEGLSFETFLKIETEPRYTRFNESPDQKHPVIIPRFKSHYGVGGHPDNFKVSSSIGMLVGFHSSYIITTGKLEHFDAGCPMLNSRGRVIAVHHDVPLVDKFAVGMRMDYWLETEYFFSRKHEDDMEKLKAQFGIEFK
jgi:hypothetical protein